MPKQRKSGKYININIINIGIFASNVFIDSSLCNSVKAYNIIKEQDMCKSHIERFLANSHIVIIVAVLSERFSASHMRRILKFLSTKKRQFVTIASSPKPQLISAKRVLKSCRMESSILIVEHQEDYFIAMEKSPVEKLKKTVSTLCSLIDVEIEEIRMCGDYFSSLISLGAFFGKRCELFLYANYTDRQIRNELEKKSKFGLLFEHSDQFWVRFISRQSDKALDDKNLDMIELLDGGASEDAYCVFYPKLEKSRQTIEACFSTLFGVLSLYEKVRMEDRK